MDQHLTDALKRLNNDSAVPCSSDPGDVRNWHESVALLKYINELLDKAWRYDTLCK